MQQLGAPAHIVEQARALAGRGDQVPRDFHVWHDCVESVQLFLGLRSQWRYLAGMAHVMRTGLDYAGVEARIRQLRGRRRRQRELFEDVMLMEQAVLDADAELRKRESDR